MSDKKESRGGNESPYPQEEWGGNESPYPQEEWGGNTQPGWRVRDESGMGEQPQEIPHTADSGGFDSAGETKPIKPLGKDPADLTTGAEAEDQFPDSIGDLRVNFTEGDEGPLTPQSPGSESANASTASETDPFFEIVGPGAGNRGPQDSERSETDPFFELIGPDAGKRERSGVRMLDDILSEIEQESGEGAGEGFSFDDSDLEEDDGEEAYDFLDTGDEGADDDEATQQPPTENEKAIPHEKGGREETEETLKSSGRTGGTLINHPLPVASAQTTSESEGDSTPKDTYREIPISIDPEHNQASTHTKQPTTEAGEESGDVDPEADTVVAPLKSLEGLASANPTSGLQGSIQAGESFIKTTPPAPGSPPAPLKIHTPSLALSGEEETGKTDEALMANIRTTTFKKTILVLGSALAIGVIGTAAYLKTKESFRPDEHVAKKTGERGTNISEHTAESNSATQQKPEESKTIPYKEKPQTPPPLLPENPIQPYPNSPDDKPESDSETFVKEGEEAKGFDGYPTTIDATFRKTPVEEDGKMDIIWECPDPKVGGEIKEGVFVSWKDPDSTSLFVGCKIGNKVVYNCTTPESLEEEPQTFECNRNNTRLDQ